MLLTPDHLGAAVRGRDRRAERGGRPAVVHLAWTLAYPFNLTGQPAVTVPCGFTTSGLPVGLQIVGKRYADGAVLRAAAAFEAARPWADRRPSL